MKKTLIAVFAAASMLLPAANAPVNKLLNKNWYPLQTRPNEIKPAGEIVKVDKKTGLIEVVNAGKDKKGKWTCTGANQGLNFTKNGPRAIRVGGECKAENVSGKRLDNDFSIYMDITYMDGTRLYGQCVQFEPGTHDWKKYERSFKFPKEVKSISFYVFLRNKTGKASFRNIYLYVL